MSLHLLDANTYIEAKNRYYGFDICPAYWQWLDLQFSQGHMASIDFIARELKAGNDELVAWVSDRPHHFLSNDDEDTQTCFASIAEFIAAGDYNPANRDNFLTGADPWIIAKAKTTGAVLVTHEARRVDGTKKVKVPNICRKFDVECVTTFEFLRNLKAQFVLS